MAPPPGKVAARRRAGQLTRYICKHTTDFHKLAIQVNPGEKQARLQAALKQQPPSEAPSSCPDEGALFFLAKGWRR
jgi:hypothetical protein